MQEMELKIDHCTITSLYTHQEMRDKNNRRKLLIPGFFPISKYMYCMDIAGLVLLYFSSQIWCHVMWLWLGRTDNILELWHSHHKFRDIRLKYKLFHCVTMFFFSLSHFFKEISVITSFGCQRAHYSEVVSWYQISFLFL